MCCSVPFAFTLMFAFFRSPSAVFPESTYPTSVIWVCYCLFALVLLSSAFEFLLQARVIINSLLVALSSK